ncbi:hypothetical protein NL676_018415 [Syzygium grande]|nr:hypothetical protein NL676_018415 [Syzygium grande]
MVLHRLCQNLASNSPTSTWPKSRCKSAVSPASALALPASPRSPISLGRGYHGKLQTSMAKVVHGIPDLIQRSRCHGQPGIEVNQE